LVVLAGQAAETPVPAASHHVRGSPISLADAGNATQEPADNAPADNATKVPHIFQAIFHIVEEDLLKGKHQGLTALIALVAGLFFVFAGKTSFDLLVTLVVGYVLGELVMASVGDMWHLDHHSPLRQVVGFEAFAIGVWGANVGKKGMNILAGVLLGFWFTYYLQHILVGVGAGFLSTDIAHGGVPLAVVIFYTVFAGCFLYLFSTKAHDKLLALITPFIGGILTASAIAFSFTNLAQAGFMTKPLHNISPDLEPVGDTWVQFALMLCSPVNKDVGIFANSKFNTLGDKWNIDRLSGLFLWFIFWVVGVVKQWKDARKNKGKASGEDSARELQLQQPLLEPAE